MAEVLAEARDNVAFGTPDEWAGLAEPDGVPVVEQDLWRDELLAMPTADKIALAKELERLTLAADGRVRVDEADYADVQAEGAVATSTGIATSGRETGAYLSVSTLADDGDVTHTGFGFTVGRSPADFDPEKAAREAAERATRLLGATKPGDRQGDRRARPVRVGAAHRHHRFDAERRGGAQGPLDLRRPRSARTWRRRTSP